MAEIQDGKSFFAVSRLLDAMRSLLDAASSDVIDPAEKATVIENVERTYATEKDAFIEVMERLVPNIADADLKKQLEDLLTYTKAY